MQNVQFDEGVLAPEGQRQTDGPARQEKPEQDDGEHAEDQRAQLNKHDTERREPEEGEQQNSREYQRHQHASRHSVRNVGHHLTEYD